MTESQQTPMDPRTTRIEENGVVFPLLMLDDCEAVEAECRRRIIAAYAQLADDCGLAGEAKFGALTASGPVEQLSLQAIYNFVFSPAGIRCVLHKSLDRAGVKADEQAAIVSRYTGYNGFNLAMALMGQMSRQTPDEIAAEMKRRADAAITPSTPEAGASDQRSPDSET